MESELILGFYPDKSLFTEMKRLQAKNLLVKNVYFNDSLQKDLSNMPQRYDYFKGSENGLTHHYNQSTTNCKFDQDWNTDL